MAFSLFQTEKQIKKLQEELEVAKEKLKKTSLYWKSLFSFVPLAISTISPEGIILDANKKFEELTGFNKEEVVGKPIISFFKEKENIKSLLEIATYKGSVSKEELIIHTKDNRKLIVNISFLARRDESDNLIDFFVAWIDITRFKALQSEMETKIQERTKVLEDSRKALLNILEDTEEARRRAEEERKKTEIVIKHFVDGLMMFDDKKKAVLINPKGEEFLQEREKNVLGKDLQSIAGLNARCKLLYKTLGKEIKEVFRQEMPINENFTLEVTTAPIAYTAGKKFSLVILHDISREKLVERMKSQFVSIAAHQLRTPLSIVKWSLSLLTEEGNLNEDEKDLVGKAYKTNERMINLVNDLLNVARIEEGRFVYRPKIVEFSEVVQSVYDSLQSLAKQKNIQFSYKNSRGKKIVKVDVEKLSLAMRNLAENALRYTPEKGKISMTLEKKGKELLFSIKDTGVGIPKDQQARIFSKFFRGANVIRMQTEGSGLGLFITKNIIEAHGGKIWFESIEKKGTTFYFTLPLIL